MDELRIIGDDIWFEGIKIGSLTPLCATAADRVRSAVAADYTGVAYRQGWEDGYAEVQEDDWNVDPLRDLD